MNNLLYWKKELGLNSETNKNLVILFQLLDYNHFARHFLYRPHTPFGWGKGVLCMFGFARSLIYLLDNRRVCLTNFWGAFILFDSREWRINKMKWGRIICIVSALRCQAFSWKNKDPPFTTRSPLSPFVRTHFSGVLFARVKYYFIWLFAAWQRCLRLMKDPGPQKGWQWVREGKRWREKERGWERETDVSVCRSR